MFGFSRHHVRYLVELFPMGSCSATYNKKDIPDALINAAKKIGLVAKKITENKISMKGRYFLRSLSGEAVVKPYQEYTDPVTEKPVDQLILDFSIPVHERIVTKFYLELFRRLVGREYMWVHGT